MYKNKTINNLGKKNLSKLENPEFFKNPKIVKSYLNRKIGKVNSISSLVKLEKNFKKLEVIESKSNNLPLMLVLQLRTLLLSKHIELVKASTSFNLLKSISSGPDEITVESLPYDLNLALTRNQEKNSHESYIGYSNISVQKLVKKNLPYLKKYVKELMAVRERAQQQGNNKVYNICSNKIAIFVKHIAMLENLKISENPQITVNQFFPKTPLNEWDVYEFAKAISSKFIKTNLKTTAFVEKTKIDMGKASNQEEEEEMQKCVKVYFGDRAWGGGVLRKDKPFLQEETGVAQNPFILLMLAHSENSVHRKNKSLLHTIEGGEHISEKGIANPIYISSTHTTVPIDELSQLYGDRMEKNNLSKEILDGVDKQVRAKKDIFVENTDGHLFLAAPRNRQYFPNHLASIYKIFQTAYTGFSGVVEAEKVAGNNTAITIESGILGCGVFNNDVAASISAQYLAAKLAGVNIVFKVPNKESYEKVTDIVNNMDNLLEYHPLPIDKKSMDVSGYLNFIYNNLAKFKQKNGIDEQTACSVYNISTVEAKSILSGFWHSLYSCFIVCATSILTFCVLAVVLHRFGLTVSNPLS